MKTSKNTLLKVLSLNSISISVSFVLGLISSKIIAVFLGPSGMALMGSFRNFSSMLKSMATLGVNNSLVTQVVKHKDDEKELAALYTTFFGIFIIISTVLGVLTIFFASQLSVFLFYSEAYLVPIRFFGLLLPFIVLNVFWLAIYNGLECYKKIVIIQIVSNILVFGVTALLIWYDKLNGGLLSFAVGEMLMVLVTYFFVRKESRYFKISFSGAIHSKYLKVIGKFSMMALLSAILVPLTVLLVRDILVKTYSLKEAGIWDAVNRLSGFYMMFFGSGLSLYYMPKLASLTNVTEFKNELKTYFTTFLPLFGLFLLLLYLVKNGIATYVFSTDFYPMSQFIGWQLAGDFLKMMSLAFGYQILVKTMVVRYCIIEIVFNISYYFLAGYLIPTLGIEGALQAYFFANCLSLTVMLLMFRRLWIKW